MTVVRSSNMNLLFSSMVAAVALLALGASIAYRASVAQQFRNQAIANCLAIETLKTAIRNGLIEREAQAVKQPGLDVATLAAIRATYRHEIARYAPAEC